MSTDTIIRVEGVSKKFCRSLKSTMRYGVRDVARDVFGFPQSSNGLRRDEFWALNDLSFDVRRGECLGLIGPNGAGKSTLLKLLNGITLPDKGKIKIAGRIGALLELGAGFHPMLTGRENIHLSGAILGLSKDELAKKLDNIVDFAGLEEFIDSPVKHYSSGMYVRLGFAIAAHVDPDVLLIDEALAVGDILFQSKCFAKLKEFKENGVTIIFVTQSLDLVTSHCSRALFLDRGMLSAQGTPKEVVDHYNRVISFGEKTDGALARDRDFAPQQGTSNGIEWCGLFRLNANEERYGTKRAEVLEAGLFTPDYTPVQVLERNREYLIKVKVRHNCSMPTAIVSYTIKDPKGVILCGTNTKFQDLETERMVEGDVITVSFRQVIRLNPGEYLLCVGAAAYEDGDYVVYDRRYDYLSFQVVSSEPRVGLFDAESVIEWTRGV